MIYKCEDCGCRLDPGEGRLCEECNEKHHRVEKNQEILQQMIFFTECKQMEMGDCLK